MGFILVLQTQVNNEVINLQRLSSGAAENRLEICGGIKERVGIVGVVEEVVGCCGAAYGRIFEAVGLGGCDGNSA